MSHTSERCHPMGYTHYWYTHRDAPRDAFGRTALDAKRLFEVAADLGYELAGWDGSGEPELSEGAIAFNGSGEGHYETFRLEAEWSRPEWQDVRLGARFAGVDPMGWRFDCCKIGFLDPEGFRAYGDVVEALLIRAKRHYGQHLAVSSDGEWDESEGAWGTWAKGRDLYRIAFGEEPECPFSREVEDADA